MEYYEEQHMGWVPETLSDWFWIVVIFMGGLYLLDWIIAGLII